MKVCIFIDGSRVRNRHWSSQFGKIRSIAKKTAVVEWDGYDKPERVHLDNLVLETAEDVAKREHEAAMRKWRDERPDTVIAIVEYNHRYGMGNDAIGASARPRTPAEMRQAADELRQLADWFETKPKETP